MENPHVLQNESYIQYLLIRNFSNKIEDKLPEELLQFLLKCQDYFGQEQFTKLSNCAKQVKKDRKKLNIQDFSEIKQKEEQQFSKINQYIILYSKTKQNRSQLDFISDFPKYLEQLSAENSQKPADANENSEANQLQETQKESQLQQQTNPNKLSQMDYSPIVNKPFTVSQLKCENILQSPNAPEVQLPINIPAQIPFKQSQFMSSVRRSQSTQLQYNQQTDNEMMRTFNDQIQQLQLKMKKMEQLNWNIQQENQRLQTQVSYQMQHSQNLEKQDEQLIMQLKEENSELLQKLKKADMQCMQLKAENQNIKQQIHQNMMASQTYEQSSNQKVQILTQQLRQQFQRQNEIEDTNNQLQVENQELEKQLKIVQQQQGQVNYQQQAQISKLLQENADVSSKLELSLNNFGNKELSQNTQINMLNAKLKLEQEAVSELKIQFSSLQSEYDKLHQKYKEQGKQLVESEANHNTRITQVINETKLSNQKLIDANNILKDEKMRLSNQIEELINKSHSDETSAYQQIQQLKENISQSNQDYKSLESKNQKLIEQNAQLQKKFEYQQQHSADVAKEVQKANRRLENCRKFHASLNQLVNNKVDEVDLKQLFLDISGLVEINAHIAESKIILQKEVSAIQNSIQGLQQQISSSVDISELVEGVALLQQIYAQREEDIRLQVNKSKQLPLKIVYLSKSNSLSMIQRSAQPHASEIDKVGTYLSQLMSQMDNHLLEVTDCTSTAIQNFHQIVKQISVSEDVLCLCSALITIKNETFDGFRQGQKVGTVGDEVRVQVPSQADFEKICNLLVKKMNTYWELFQVQIVFVGQNEAVVSELRYDLVGLGQWEERAAGAVSGYVFCE